MALYENPGISRVGFFIQLNFCSLGFNGMSRRSVIHSSGGMMSVRETLVGFPLERNFFPEGSRLYICIYIRDIACTCTSSLFLNVWTPPGAKRASKIPVMIWLYGGGFQLGASSHPEYDGARLANRGERPRPPGIHFLHSEREDCYSFLPPEGDAFSYVHVRVVFA